MKISNFITLPVMLCLFANCFEKAEHNVITVDMNAAADILLLSEIADSIVYVKLETKDCCLLGHITDLKFKNDYYYVADKSNSIFKFDRLGNYVSKIHKFGQGPEEYVFIQSFDIDKYNNIHILDLRLRKILKYDRDFNFVSSTRIEDFPRDFAALDNSYLLYMPDKNLKYRRGLYTLNITSGALNEIFTIKSKSEVPCMINNYIRCNGNGKFSIIDNSLNKVHFLLNDSLINSLHIALPEREEYILYKFFDYDKFLLLFITKIKQGTQSLICLYDKQTQTSLTFSNILNDTDAIPVGKGSIIGSTDSNIMICLIPAENLGYNSEDNPVLQIIHLK